MAEPSWDAVTRVVPSGLHVMVLTVPLCPRSSVATRSHVSVGCVSCVFQISISAGSPTFPNARSLLLGLHAVPPTPSCRGEMVWTDDHGGKN